MTTPFDPHLPGDRKTYTQPKQQRDIFDEPTQPEQRQDWQDYWWAILLCIPPGIAIWLWFKGAMTP